MEVEPAPHLCDRLEPFMKPLVRFVAGALQHLGYTLDGEMAAAVAQFNASATPIPPADDHSR